MNRKIKRFLKTEGEVLGYYTILCNCEISSDYYDYFDFITIMFQNSLEKEAKILDRMSDSDLEYLLYIDKDSIQKGNNLISRDEIISRIHSLAKKSGSRCSDYKPEDIYNYNRPNLDSIQVVNEEYLNILMSFYDEYLKLDNGLSNYKTRYDLAVNKYRLLYSINDSKVEYRMTGSLSLYYSKRLNDKLESSVYYIPTEIISLTKIALAYDILNKHNDLLQSHNVDEIENNGDLLIRLFQVRTSLLLLAEKESLEYLSKLGINEDNAWYKMILNDRERYNTETKKHIRIK